MREYIRKNIYPINEILSKILPMGLGKRKEAIVQIDGEESYMSSHRYHTFKEKGIKCVVCGIEGKYFAQEKSDENHKRWHFNLYALNSNGEEVLMTKDHILPKSKGGRDILKNYQTMCYDCNQEKGDKIIIENSLLYRSQTK